MYNVDMTITMKLNLYKPNRDKHQKLLDYTMTQRDCVNWWLEIIEKEGMGLKSLQNNHYKDARRLFGLDGVPTQMAMFTAIRMVKAAKGKVFRLNKITSTTKEVRIDGNNVGLLIGGGRTWIPFKSRELPQAEYRESKLSFKDGRWYLYLSVEVDEPKPNNFKRTMGVDLGVAKIAVTSDWNGKNTVFYRGEALRHKRQHYHSLRKDLQSKGKYRTLKKIRRHEQNWVTDTNHKISRNIVNRAVSQKRSIAVENLSGIRERIIGTKKTRRMLSAWSFRQLVSFIEYKARLAGVAVSAVDPRETSRRCFKCGYVSKSNRTTQERFKCKQCGYESNADRVAAVNIAQRATGVMA